MANHILIVDDDIKICTLLQKLLLNNGFMAVYATSAEHARQVLEYISIDVAVIDYMMSPENGMQVVLYLHDNYPHTSSLMLTAVGETENKIKAFTTGVDDYLTKPFDSEELILRLRSLIKRNSFLNSSSKKLIIGDFIFNKENSKLIINNMGISLSAADEDILKVFVENPNMILSKEDILEKLGKPITDSNLNNLNVNIFRLRKKLEPNSEESNKYIKTIRGKGFILVV